MFDGQTALVVGGSRGFGRGIVEALVAKQMTVYALARNAAALNTLAEQVAIHTIAADATDESVVSTILAQVQPNLLVLCAGSALQMAPLHEQTWESFSQAWEVDTKSTFLWTKEALRKPTHAPLHVVIFGSGAALQGSSLSGGYAGAKRMNAFIADYATGIASRLNLAIRFHCLIPPLSPSTEFGAAAAAAYARQAGVDFETFVKRLPSPTTPKSIGAAVVALHQDPAKWTQVAYRVSGDGLTSLQ